VRLDKLSLKATRMLLQMKVKSPQKMRELKFPQKSPRKQHLMSGTGVSE